MAGQRTFVVVGANQTGGAAAVTLRQDGFDGRIVLIGAENHPPYERPPLSKDYLRGETTAEKVLFQTHDWYDENDVELMLGTTAARIDPEAKVVHLVEGDPVPYDSVLISTGGRNRRLDVPGADLPGVLDLRTIEDSDRIRLEASPGRRAVVVGAGFIGCEVASSLRRLGVDVDVVEFFAAPLIRVVGEDVARVIETFHREHGVRFHFGHSVTGFEGSDRVEAVTTDQGARLECDFAVVGVGIEPNTDVVTGTGVEVERGILVDERCRTNVEGVFAAGDVANHLHPLFGRLRVEHWDNALKQGAAAARSMMGREEAFDDPHWFWSDQYDQNLQYLGFAPRWDQFLTRGDVDARSFVGFYVTDGVVRAVVGLNRGREVRRSAGLIRAAKPVDPAALVDEDVDLKSLAAQLAGGGR
jgi:3-phenylpropionate/trans-cinnamate dioxygenase ferredoxin reductase component